MVDTNVFYNFLFETELTEEATKIFELEEPLFTSFTVINETLYVVSRKIAERKFDIRSYRRFREFVSGNGYEHFLELLRSNNCFSWVKNPSCLALLKLTIHYGKQEYTKIGKSPT
ncbi:MAG: hypothetical protein DRO98_08160 [Archaeoglobales archaeon]|nr:MAG: hypothetical protein DRO98_08160 [Archaeoglobales archaeon]